MDIIAAEVANQTLSSDVIEIEAARFWKDAYDAVYPGTTFQRFLMEWKEAKRALCRGRQD